MAFFLENQVAQFPQEKRYNKKIGDNFMASFFERFQTYVIQQYPLLSEGIQILSPFLVSPEVVRIPQTLEGEMKSLIELLLFVRKEPSYRQEVETQAGLLPA